MIGWYYLHTNGELIYKRFEPEQDPGGFVRHVWPADTRNRMDAWTILVEALELGANVERVRELAQHWGCDAKDLTQYVARLTKPTAAQARGVEKFIRLILNRDPKSWWEWLASTPKGELPDFDMMPKCLEPERTTP